MSSPVRTSSVVAACVGTITAACVAYAVYFDHRRRSDPDFRRALRREAQREAREAKSQAEAVASRQRSAIRRAVDEANLEEFPRQPDEVEKYFMAEIAHGESISNDDSRQIEAALSFYKALKVYPSPRELISVYDKTLPKPLLDILAEMVAIDPTISVRPSSLNDQAATIE